MKVKLFSEEITSRRIPARHSRVASYNIQPGQVFVSVTVITRARRYILGGINRMSIDQFSGNVKSLLRARGSVLQRHGMRLIYYSAIYSNLRRVGREKEGSRAREVSIRESSQATSANYRESKINETQTRILQVSIRVSCRNFAR